MALKKRSRGKRTVGKRRSRGKRTVNNDEISLEKLPRGAVGTAEIHRVELYHPGDNQD